MVPSVMRAVIGAVVVCAAGAVQADVFKCRAPDGGVRYQAVPCAGAGGQINASPSSGPAAPYWRKSAGERDIEKMERIERERERSRDISRAEQRYDDALDRIDKHHCDRIAAEADRYREHERAGGSARRIDWYKAERKAAEARYDRECR